MKRLQISRSTLYALLNAGDLESYTQGRSRRITVRSINSYVERRLADEAQRRGHAAKGETSANAT